MVRQFARVHRVLRQSVEAGDGFSVGRKNKYGSNALLDFLAGLLLEIGYSAFVLT